ncbi:MAG TPA: aldehyde dehydrogenase family protein [Gammaproteobacteria bacterium]|nr:aldehyde dehydrogenase family protein [Gammaproteobacteria bacterium]
MDEIFARLDIKPDSPSASLGDGRFLKSEVSAEKIISVNPSTNQKIAEVFASNPEQYDQVVKHAQQCFHTWRQVPAPKRGELIRKIANRLRELKDPLGSLVSLEMGKSKQEGDGEVQEMIDIADFAVGQSRMLYGKTMPSERIQHRMFEQWHPYGVTGVITAFNFPVAVWSWNAFIAAVCGNTVVWKPSQKVPLCAIAVQHVCNAVMQEEKAEGVFSLFIPKSLKMIENFVQDPRIPLISFTGSCAVGRQVNMAVAKRMGRSILELGGNNAIIIDETANVNLAIPAIVFGAVGTAGQRCTTTRRLFIHRSRYQDVIEKLVAAYKQIRVGDPLDQKNHMGPLIDQSAVEKYQQALSTVQKMGGKILFGGQVFPRAGNFVEPTIVEANNDWPIVQEETFAPILYVMSYSHLQDAISMQNQVSQGLSSALFTNSIQNAEQFISTSGSDCGLANINIGTSGSEVGGAFGGEKATGGGREAGSDAWKAYMRRQTNTINWGNALPLSQGIQFNL